MPNRRFLCGSCWVALACWLAVPAAAAELSFNRDIRPILSDNCFACHGPDKNNRQGDLRLDVREEAVAAGAIQPGKPHESALIQRIFAMDASELMPPADSHKQLTARQKEILKQWIAAGAPYELHWAFVPPAKPAAGQSIDDFVRARLAQTGLKPAPEADREALIRRVTLDLTGLPPTPAEVDAFLADESADAYQRVVDRLLASPHFGERMAVDWLDAARYADTNGYQVDRDRELWPWRDWVIQAFNANMPFDQFTVEQLAGDLLPNATLTQKIATGFHRNHMLNEEGGIIPEEFLAEYTADRVETTAAVWLGQTFNCARCHDHKFDPFTQRDFYSLKAFFHNVPERGVGIYSNPIRINAPPFVRLPSPAIEARIADLTAKLKPIEEQLKELTDVPASEIEAWAQKLATAQIDWQPLAPLTATGGDQPPQIAGDVVEIGSQETRATNLKIQVQLPSGQTTALRLECSTQASAASVQWSELKAGKSKLRPLDAAHSKLVDNDRKTRFPLSVAPNQLVAIIFELESPLDGGELEVTLVVENAKGPSRWRVLATTAPAELLAPENIMQIARKEVGQRTDPERKQLADYRLSRQPDYQRLNDESASLKKQIAAAEAEIPTTLVMEEQPEPRPTFVLMRGAYDKPGEPVTAATPAVLPALAADLPRNRLGLARWLVSPENPLTARVTVNRFWQQFFGTGLVRSSEDFGSQGEPPSHPELLDWLAVTFQESGWDVKQLVRLIVTSHTYQQRAGYNAADPENRLLAHGPRHRLPAEMIRDQALAASGLLVGNIGGPSVKPYHPPGIYETITAGSGYNTYVPGKGADLYRRSLYTYWKRSVPHPAMLLFDAPFRETCTLRRARTNTPLQALNLLNDPTHVEAARFLAVRMMTEGGETDESRIAYGFRLLLTRRPNAAELPVLTAALQRARGDFSNDAEAAKQFLAVGDTRSDPTLAPADLAAFTLLASTLLNLDEVITKE